ncbi:hypothetical protein HNR46_000883 [Haloferula luteola]|uniref:Uncharacterized protein n=1 Tax=Haloferula luteola TaxID=595692 RepID=A0A840UY46_9BACT|nr:hypothetical protein [Haloferula luteola]
MPDQFIPSPRLMLALEWLEQYLDEVVESLDLLSIDSTRH